MANSNGWGDGASNNNIGWGQGAVNNSIYWGYFHALSAAGLTDIVGQTFQPESVAYFTAIEDAGGTLTDNVKAEWDAVIVALKDANLYSRFHFITPKLGGKAASAVLDATGNLIPINVNFTDADADPLIGLKGDGSTKKINYGIAANAMLSNFNWAIGVQYITQPLADKYTLGAYNSASEVVNLRFGTTNSLIYGQSLSISDAQTTLATYPQIHIGSRVSQTSLKLYVNGSGTAATTTSDTGTIPATNFAEYGLGLLLPEDSKHGIAFATDGLNDAEASTINGIFTTFYNNITAYAALMDSYSGAAAAYSLRKLYSSYEGSAINVRRSSDNATQDIGFDGYILDTASLLSFVGAGSGYVTTWYDQSGSGNNAIQGTAANQPLIVSSGSLITTNGLPAIDFDTDDYLSFTAITPITTFTVGKLDALSLLNYILYNLTAGRGYIYGGLLPGADGIGVYDGAVKTITGEDLNSHLAYFNYDSTLYQVAKDETTATNLAAGANFEVNQIGRSTSNLSFNGTIQEIVSYSIDNSLNKAAIESLINSYYGIY